MAREHELIFRLSAQTNGAFQSTFRNAQQSMQSFREQYNALANTAKDISAYERQQQAVENTRAKLELLRTQYSNIQREINETGHFSSDLENKLAAKGAQIDKTTEALGNQTDKLNQYEAALQQAGVDTNNLKDASAQLEKEMGSLRESMDESADSTQNIADSLNNLEQLAVGVGLVKLGQELADFMRDAADAAMEFEAGMASVRRTVGGSAEDIANLGEEFKDMAAVMPITTSELNEIATTAGQLGIAREDVRSFTEVMAKLATTTDLTADEAATLLAQFVNITGTTDFERLGSTVAALGDATATTASRVVTMSQRIASAATVAGMSERDILGISAAVGALGYRAQMGSTAVSQLITKMQLAVETGDGLEGFASVANMTAEQFKTAWGQDAAGALNAFIHGLNNVEQNGKTALAVLDDMGISNARQVQVFTGMANNADMLTRTLELANQSWNENTALTEKSAIMYDTTRAKMVAMQNNVNNLKIAIGDQFTPTLGKLYDELAKVAGGLADFVQENPGVVKALASVTAGLAALTVSLGLAKAGVAAFNLITQASLGPIGWVSLAISGLAMVLTGFALSADDANDSAAQMATAIGDMEAAVKNANDKIADAQTETTAAAMTADRYIDRPVEIEAAGEMTAASHAEYAAILKEVQGLLPGVSIELDEQTGLVKDGAASLHNLAEGWKQAAMQQAYYEAYTEKSQAWAKVRLEVEETQDKLLALQSQLPPVLDEIAKKEQALSYVQAKRNALTLDGVGNTELYMQMQGQYDRQIVDLQNDIFGLYSGMTDEEREAMVEQENLTAALAAGKAELNRYSGEMDNIAAKMDIFNVETEIAEGTLEQLPPSIQAVFGSLNELSDAYDENYKAVSKAVEKQFDMWEEVPAVADSSVAELMTALQTQTTYWQEYSDNVTNLNSRNIEGINGFVAALADGTTDSAGYLAELAKLSDDELKKVVEAFNGLESAEGGAKQTLTSVQTDVDNTMKALVETVGGGVEDMNMSYEARMAAIDTINAYIDAAEGLVGPVRDAYGRVASAARDALQYGGMTGYGHPTGSNGYDTTVDYGHAAIGVTNAPAGWYEVGEHGPELVYLHGGETVLPNTKTVELMDSTPSGNSVSVTIAPVYNITGGNPQEIRAILEEHDRELPDKVRAVLRYDAREATRLSYH